MSNINEHSNDPWNNEQAPFAGAETQAEVSEATHEAAATPHNYAAEAAGAVPPPPPPPGAGAYNTAGGPAGWGPVNAPYGAPPVAVPVSSSEPNPGLAFFLGFIPGVGAMYNGQIVKGFIHLIVFAVFVTLSDNVNGVFGLLVAGWVFFMAFEAYHTAKARRDGLPLPNAFGWNDIGERFGLGKNWFSPGAGVPNAPTGTAQGAAPNWTAVPPAPQAGAPPYAGSAQYAHAPNWAGYVPPTAFAGAPPVNPGPGSFGGNAAPPIQGVPYAPVNAGDPYSGVPPANLPPNSRLPVGAFWLIGLGLLFLLGQWSPLLHWSHVWVPSILLTGFAIFLFARRMGWTGSPVAAASAGLPIELRAAIALRAPGALLAIAILNGLHEAWVVRWNHSWPVLLIVIGVLMLVERAALRQAAQLDPMAVAPVDGGVL